MYELYLLQERRYHENKERTFLRNQLANIGQVASALGGGKATAYDFGFVDMGVTKSARDSMDEVKKAHLLKLAKQRQQRHLEKKKLKEQHKNGN